MLSAPGQADAFFRRLVRGPGADAEGVGAEAYLKSSALAAQLPSWCARHDADLAVAEAKAHEPFPSRRSCCRASRAIVAHDRRAELQEGAGATLAICARDDTVTPLYFTEELVP